MKPVADFFSTDVPTEHALFSDQSRLPWHADGVSVGSLFSIRLSNIPQNLRWIARGLKQLSQNPTAALWPGLA